MTVEQSSRPSLKDRFDRNPFISEGGTTKEKFSAEQSSRIKVVRRIDEHGQDASRSYLTTTEHGSIVRSSFVEHITVDKTRFLKFYTDTLGLWLLDLSKTARRVLICLLREYQSEINKDILFFTLKTAKHYDSKISNAVLHKGLVELIEAQLIAPAEKGPHWFWVNPYYIFNGSRIKYTKIVEARDEARETQEDIDSLMSAEDQEELVVHATKRAATDSEARNVTKIIAGKRRARERFKEKEDAANQEYTDTVDSFKKGKGK